MTIKYEPVFGDQSKFTKEDSEIYVWQDLLGGLEDTIEGFKQRMRPAKGNAIIAMRRVIKTPTWTRADQEAGVLPEFLSEILFTGGDEPEIVEYLGENGGNIWYFKRKDGAVTSAPVGYLEPIETPEERAARLKESWVVSTDKLIDKAMEKEGVASWFNALRIIHDALLSGELKAPTND